MKNDGRNSGLPQPRSHQRRKDGHVPHGRQHEEDGEGDDGRKDSGDVTDGEVRAARHVRVDGIRHVVKQ
jgi:hypothetical protein